MPRVIIAYLATVVPFLAIDAFWLTYVAKPFFVSNIGHLMADEPNLGAAAIFYLLYVVGIVYFAVLPGLNRGSVMLAGLNGALFGLFAYATYDVTNYATLKGWPLQVVLVDTTWGTVLTGVSALAGYLIARRFV